MAITPKSYSRIQSKNLTAKSMAKLLGQRSSTAWAGWSGMHKHWALTGLLEEKGLPLLLYLVSESNLYFLDFWY